MNSANPPDGGQHKVLIVGGGSAGLTLAARLRRSGLPDVAVLEPSASHRYQPLWTLVGGGRAPQRALCGRNPGSCQGASPGSGPPRPPWTRRRSG